jgi:type VI protein secretion system component VasK
VLSRFIAKIAIAFAMLLIGLIGGVIAVAFFGYGVYLALLNVLVAPAAAAITGVVILAGAALLMLILRAVLRPRHRRRSATIPSLEQCESAAEIGTELGRKIRGIAGAHASGGLLASLVAGFALGASPKLRAFLQAILKP